MQRHQIPWKERVQELFQTCSEEIRRTTEIGKKMLSASKTNSHLHESYEELGRLVAQALENKSLQWEEPRAHELLNLVKNCQKDLENLEDEVNKIKFSETNN